LKDASSAALYGSRAANGVHHIPQKKVRKNKPYFQLEKCSSGTAQEHFLSIIPGVTAEQYIH